MNTVRQSNRFILLLLTFSLVMGSRLFGQEEPTAPTPPAAPVVVSAEPEKAAAPAAAPEEAEVAVTEDDQPAKVDEAVVEAADQADQPAKKEVKSPKKDRSKNKKWNAHGSHRSGNNDRVGFGSNSTLNAGEKANAVVSIGGSSTSAGEVSDAVVSILGSSRVTGGTVGDSVVSVLGNTYVNGHVKGEVVAVLGHVELGPDAVVDGEVVCIGGQVKRDPAAIVHGGTQNFGVAGHYFNFDGVSAWFSQCFLYARPLAFGDNLMWAWLVALIALGLYALIALIAPSGVEKCVETLEQRPGSSLLAALLTMLLTPVAYILLVITIALVVGVVLIPLFSLGLFFAAIFGKIVMLAWLGRRVTKLFGATTPVLPVIAVLVGGGIILLLYTIPVAGFIIYKLLGILGLGVVVYTLILQYKNSRPPRPLVAAAAAAQLSAAATAVTPPDNAAAVPPTTVPLAPVLGLPPVISAATLPRAGFWLRLGASFIDFIMLGAVIATTFKVFHGWFSPGGSLPFWFAVYCVVMWASKGTTIGGIICGLKVVRLDDRPLDWGVAIVRALGGFLSLTVAGLGFIWVAFDDERQSWHDKIAGTTIVQVPKGTPLL